jgi:hypothetical protein
MSDPISEQAEAFARGEAVGNPYPADSYSHAALNLNRAGREFGREFARAIGIYWLVDKLAGILKR